MGKGYRIVTIEREYASGGSQVGHLVGESLGIPVYGREILELAAKKGEKTPEYIQHLEETCTNSLLYSLLAMSKSAKGQLPQLSQTDQLNLLEAQIIQELSQQGPCVMVGRCAGWVLRERKDALNVFIHGDLETRIQRAVTEYGIPEKEALGVLHHFDHRRANFYHANTNLNWRERIGYHMVLDSGKLGIEACGELISHMVRESKK